MAMKVVKQDKYNFTYNGTPQTISLIIREGKQRRRSYMTGKIEWTNVRRLSVVCSLYPKCEWFPYSDGDFRGATFSCEGWEPDRSEFKIIDKIAETLICKERGWPTDENVDKLLNELSNTTYEVDESLKRKLALEQRFTRLETATSKFKDASFNSKKNERHEGVNPLVRRKRVNENMIGSRGIEIAEKLDYFIGYTLQEIGRMSEYIDNPKFDLQDLCDQLDNAWDSLQVLSDTLQNKILNN